MTLSNLNYEAPMAAKSTGLGLGFVTPQRAKIERSRQFQNMDLFASQNLLKPKQTQEKTITPNNPIVADSDEDIFASQNLFKPQAKTTQPVEQTLDIGNPGTDIFASPDLFNTFNSSLQANLSANPIKNPGVDERNRLDFLQRVANTGAPLGGTDYRTLLDKAENERLKRYGIQNSNIPKAGQALSEPYKPNKVTGANNSSFDYKNFTNALNTIRDEQNFYKELSDPNFKILSEEEMAKQADERFNKEYANKTSKDLYEAPNLAAVERQRQQAIKDFAAGKGSKARIGFSSPEYALSAAQQSAADLFERSKGRARASILSELRQQQAAKQYFDSEEGKKRIDAGKKLLDFYGTYSAGGVSPLDNSGVYGADKNSPFLFDERALKAYQTGERLSPEYMAKIGKTSKDLAGLTPYQQAYLNELNKQKGTGQSVDFNKIRDTVTEDFNKSVGFTGKFVPSKYNKFNEEARKKSYFENPMKNPMTGQTYDDATLKRLFAMGTLNYDPTQKYKSVFESSAQRVADKKAQDIRLAEILSRKK